MNDYPHQNSTWPKSREVIERDMAHLGAGERRKLLSANCEKIYRLKPAAARAA
jgi:hypothetical protein